MFDGRTWNTGDLELSQLPVVEDMVPAVFWVITSSFSCYTTLAETHYDLYWSCIVILTVCAQKADNVFFTTIFYSFFPDDLSIRPTIFSIRPTIFSIRPMILIVLTTDQQTFGRLFKVRPRVIGCINHDYTRPLLRATYEVMLLHLSSTWVKTF